MKKEKTTTNRVQTIFAILIPWSSRSKLQSAENKHINKVNPPKSDSMCRRTNIGLRRRSVNIVMCVYANNNKRLSQKARSPGNSENECIHKI